MDINCCPMYFQPDGAAHTLCATRCTLHSAASSPSGPPVILCHGLGSNRQTFLLPTQRNIVHMLLEDGFDVWLAELRGHGLSTSGIAWDSPWDVDDYISDAGEFVAFVSSQASGASVRWIGHSLGGIIGAVMASSHAAKSLASVTAVASSYFYAESVFRKLSFAVPAITSVNFFPAHSFMRLQAPLSFRFVSTYVDSVMAWRSNVDAAAGRQLLSTNFEPISKRVILQLATGIQQHGVLHRDGTPFSDRLSECKTPVFLIAGDRDKQCPHHSVRQLFDRLPPNPAHKYQCFGKDDGCADHYGHFDLIIGLRVEKEVFPSIRSFLQLH